MKISKFLMKMCHYVNKTNPNTTKYKYPCADVQEFNNNPRTKFAHIDKMYWSRNNRKIN